MNRNRMFAGILLMILSALVTAAGQAFWKWSGASIVSWALYAGFFCYGIGAMLMPVAFRFGSLSVLHPLLSIGYVFSIAIGFAFLHEQMTLHEVIGDLIVVLGAIFIGIGGKREQMEG